jgi:serine/threonine-protein kinase
MAAGLDYTHSKGIIHRDIKPGNVMIVPGGGAKILDFGIARMSDVRTSTPTGVVMGTVDYMAPEQIKAEMIDGRADQFSLAAVAYRMMAGSTLFGRHTLATLAYKLVNEAPVPVCQHNAAIPPAVDPVLSKALAKSPADRYPTCSAFVEDLTQAVSGPATAAAAATGVATGETTAKTPAPAGVSVGNATKRSGMAALVAGGVLVAAGAGAVAVWKPWSGSVHETTQLPAQKTPSAVVPPVEVANRTEKAVVERQEVPPSKPEEHPLVKTPLPVKAPEPTVKKLPPPKVQDHPVVTPQPPPVRIPDPTATTPPPQPKPQDHPVVTPQPPPARTPDTVSTVPPPNHPNPPVDRPRDNEPGAQDTPFKRGMEELKSKDYQAAIRSFTEVIGRRPRMPLAFYNRGFAYQMSGQPEKAIQDFSEAIRLGTRDARAYANRGICEVRTRQDDAALADFNHALELEPGYAGALNGRGGVAYRRHQYQAAIRDFTAAIRANPEMVQAYENRANAKKAIGDQFGAADDLVMMKRLQRNK